MSIAQISVKNLRKILHDGPREDGLMLVNVASTDEHRMGHIPGAVHVPFDTLSEHAQEFKNMKTIYVHCRSGNRSRYAIEELRRLGVTVELVNVDGGLIAWEHAGFPVELG